MARKTKQYESESFPTQFGSVNRNKEKASVSLQFRKEHMSTKDAEKYLDNTQVEVELRIDPGALKDVKNQKTLTGPPEEETVGFTGEIHGFRKAGKKISATLSFDPQSVDANDIWEYGGAIGSIDIGKVADIAEKKRGRKKSEEAEKDVAGQGRISVNGK